MHWDVTLLAIARASRAGTMLLCFCGCSALRPLDELETTDSERAALEREACPPEMRLMSFPNGTFFCIDRLETKRAEYDEFLLEVRAGAAPVVEAYGLCWDDQQYEPGAGTDCLEGYVMGSAPELPAVCVDLCDAKAYCQSRGKRLCSGRGGHVTVGAQVDQLDVDEWYVACTDGTKRAYPYGYNYDAAACNTGSGAVSSGQSFAQCETDKGLFDMSGNVSEWVLVCGPDQKYCRIRGGNYTSEDPVLARCDSGRPYNKYNNKPIGARSPTIGFRCCMD